jgi:hypothetical protein
MHPRDDNALTTEEDVWDFTNLINVKVRLLSLPVLLVPTEMLTSPPPSLPIDRASGGVASTLSKPVCPLSPLLTRSRSCLRECLADRSA